MAHKQIGRVDADQYVCNDPADVGTCVAEYNATRGRETMPAEMLAKVYGTTHVGWPAIVTFRQTHDGGNEVHIEPLDFVVAQAQALVDHARELGLYV